MLTLTLRSLLEILLSVKLVLHWPECTGNPSAVRIRRKKKTLITVVSWTRFDFND